MTVIYVDSVFLLNSVMDYLLCLTTARLAGLSLRRWRYVLAGLCGGAYAVAVFLPNASFLAQTPVKFAAGVLMALIAFGGEERLLRLTLLLFLMSCAMAGCILALGLLAGSRVPINSGIFYTDVNVKVLLIAVSAAYLILSVIFRAGARHGVQGNLIPVRLCMNGKIVSLTALLDNGNSLRDPVTGASVLVVAAEVLPDIFPTEIRRQLKGSKLYEPAELLPELRNAVPELCPRLMVYEAVGVKGGMLLLLRSNWMEIAGTRYPGVSVALSPNSLGDGYRALWGGEVRKGGIRNGTGLEKTFGEIKTAEGGKYSLHWRQ